MIPEIGGDFIQWLRGFYYVVTSGGFSSAASIMCRNQSSISHQIKCLENELKIQLLVRNHNSIKLTSAGEIVFAKSVSIFETIDKLKREVHTIRESLDGQIKIAAANTITKYFLSPYIKILHDKHPKITYKIFGGGKSYILEKVERCEADFGIIALSAELHGFNYYNLFDMDFVLIVGKNSPFTLDENFSLSDIAPLPMIIFPRSSTITATIMDAFLKRELTPNIIMELNNFESAKMFTEQGLGVTILEEISVDEADHEKFNIYPLNKFLPSQRYGIIIRKDSIISQETRELLNLLQVRI